MLSRFRFQDGFAFLLAAAVAAAAGCGGESIRYADEAATGGQDAGDAGEGGRDTAGRVGKGGRGGSSGTGGTAGKGGSSGTGGTGQAGTTAGSAGRGGAASGGTGGVVAGTGGTLDAGAAGETTNPNCDTPCHDGNACTSDSCRLGSGCEFRPLPEGSAGACRHCDGRGNELWLADDDACGEIDCSGYFARSGDDSVTGTKTCHGHEPLTTGRCTPEGTCHAANGAACADALLRMEPELTCGKCEALAGCTETISGSCGEFRPGTNTGDFCGTGACQAAESCTGPGTSACTPGEPGPEICGDGIDQDCDGADESCITNDLPSDALDISNGGTFSGDITIAQNDQDYSDSSCGATGGKDVFFKFTLSAAEVVYFHTFGSTFDTVIRIFSGSCTEPSALMRCFDDDCGQTAAVGALGLEAGQYCLVLDQFSQSSGNGGYVLEFVRTGRTGSDLGITSGELGGTTAGALNQSAPSCSSDGGAGDVGYYFLSCPGLTYNVQASTCDKATWDTILYLRSGKMTSPDAACNDDGCSGLQSSLSNIRLSGPNIHWLIVDGFQGGVGDYGLNYSILSQ